MTTISPSTLWMGDLEPYMDELYLITAFEQCGVKVKNVKLIKRKDMDTATYCFVDFFDQDTAQRTMLKLNGKAIPMTNPSIRFKLNIASYGREHLSVPEYSLFVGELTEDVDDLHLYDAFHRRYPSVRTAKVVMDRDGRSKGYGFVRFTEESERKLALKEMQHYYGLGKKQIRLSVATPKSRPYGYGAYPPPPQDASDQYRAYYQQYYQQYYDASTGQWTSYPQNQYGYNYGGHDPSSSYSDAQSSANQGEMYDPYETTTTGNDDDDQLVDPNDELDVNRLNADFMERSEELYTSLEHSRWLPVSSITTKLTPEIVS